MLSLILSFNYYAHAMTDVEFVTKLFHAIKIENIARLEALKYDHPFQFQRLINSTPPLIGIRREEIDDHIPLTYAAHHDHQEVVEYLLGLPQVNINAKNIEHKTALMCAAQMGHENIVKLLLQSAKIDINMPDNIGMTALMWAAYHNADHIVKILLQHPHTHINAQDYSARTALHHALQPGREFESTVKILLDAPGIKINVKDKDGDTPMMQARMNDVGVDLIQEKIDELTARAFCAIKTHDLKTVQSITDQIGIDNISDIAGNTLLDIACISNCPKIIIFLLQNAETPQELLSRFPFGALNPSTEIFKYFVNLAYGKTAGRTTNSLAPGCFQEKPPIFDFEVADLSYKRPEFTKNVNEVASEIMEELRNRCSDGASARSEQRLLLAKLCACCGINCKKRCSICKAVYYCSVKCQQADWKTHKHTCKSS